MILRTALLVTALVVPQLDQRRPRTVSSTTAASPLQVRSVAGDKGGTASAVSTVGLSELYVIGKSIGEAAG